MKISIGIFIAVLFGSCLKDRVRHSYSYSWYEPLYKTKGEVISDIKNGPPTEIENPGKILITDKYIFLNEKGRGIHIFDNSNPSSPENISFIPIPGNIDIATQGNTLYADFYSNLLAIDITNPLKAVKTKMIENAFSYSPYYGFGGDSNNVIYDWKRHDTSIIANENPQIVSRGGVVYYDFNSANSFSSQSSINSSAPGITGSMARFAISNKYLYTVGNSDLNVFNISAPQQPTFDDNVNLGDWSIETIFPFKNKLFIGSQNGMYIYNLDHPGKPVQEGQFGHVRSCDPVIAADSFAYVTLRSGTVCQGFTNELEILSLNNFANPTLIKSYSLTNPHGLSKDGNLLFVCDGTDGFKIYNAEDVNNLKLIKNFSGTETYDVIANNNIALVVAKDGLYQFDYSDPDNIHLLSKINIAK